MRRKRRRRRAITVYECTSRGEEKPITSARCGVGPTAKARSLWKQGSWPEITATRSTLRLCALSCVEPEAAVEVWAWAGAMAAAASTPAAAALLVGHSVNRWGASQ